MSALFAWWWLALPSLLLPLWWHRQRQRQRKVYPLATAQFLAQAAPQSIAVWRWRDLLLLLLRTVILLTLLGLLAQLIVSQRGDTVFVSNKADPVWVAEQLKSIGKVNTLRYCASSECEVQTDSIIAWLEQQHGRWRAGSQWWLLATADEVNFTANRPQLDKSLDLRIAPRAAKTKDPVTEVMTIPVVIKSARYDQWQQWFQRIEQVSQQRWKFALSEQWQAGTELVIWESHFAPRQEWQAPLWWVTEASAFNGAKADANFGARSKAETSGLSSREKSALGPTLQKLRMQSMDSPQGRVWLAKAQDWPVTSMDAQASWDLLQAWWTVRAKALELPAPSERIEAQTQEASADARLPAAVASEPSLLHSEVETILLTLLLILLCCERMVNHVRRA